MAPAARTVDSVWSRLGHALAAWSPVARFNRSVLRNQRVTRSRGMAHRGWTRVLDVCYPLIVLGRGTYRCAAFLGGYWKAAPKERRRLQSLVVAACLIGVGLLRYGPLLLVLAGLGAIAWLGRSTAPKGDAETAAHIRRLQAVYDGLVPYLQNGDDPDHHFTPGGHYRDAFTAWEFDQQDRLTRLRIDYSRYFKDGEADSRAKVERAVEGKIGHFNEYLYSWDEEGNHLDVRVLPPLPDGIGAQPWPVADIEFVLGITDPDSAGRLIPVLVAEPQAADGAPAPRPAPGGAPPGFTVAQLAPAIWRIGGAGPHLLLTGAPRAGKSTLVRSLLGQALARGHRVAVMDTDQSAEYTALAGQANVLRVTEDPADSLDLLDWLGLELERRAGQRRASAHLACLRDLDQTPAYGAPGSPVPGDAAAYGAPLDRASADAVTLTDIATARSVPPEPDPPLWLFVDDLPELCAAAGRLNRPDPQDALTTLVRKARFARMTLVVTARTDQIAALRPALRNQLTTRVALGRMDAAASILLFGGTLELGGAHQMAPGRGYARIAGGPVIRLQTPYAPALAPSAV